MIWIYEAHTSFMTSTQQPTGTPIFKGEVVTILETNTFRPTWDGRQYSTQPTSHLIRRSNGQEIRVPDAKLAFRCDDWAHTFTAPESAHPAPRPCLAERCDVVREGRTFAETN